MVLVNNHFTPKLLPGFELVSAVLSQVSRVGVWSQAVSVTNSMTVSEAQVICNLYVEGHVGKGEFSEC